MKHTLSISLFLLSILLISGCADKSLRQDEKDRSDEFIRVEGPNLVKPDGSHLFIRGTNIGNWLNPEGYMFGFSRTNSASMINDLLCQISGPDDAAEFWKAFKDNYITKADIDYIASEGANTIRLPFHYKLFTDEDYMGLSREQDGFERVDSIVEWCRANDMYLILDMHDAPGGQTGDNIDDSYGYPFLMESEMSQKRFIEIWRKIADYYKNEPVILGYELINEPVATYFENRDELNSSLMNLYRETVDAIREVDKEHIILIGSPQWNSNFEPVDHELFTNDPQIMYTCHRYGGDPTAEAIKEYIEFRDLSERPMYMGEIGHNTDKWQNDFVKVMEDNNIGYTFWPYKKIGGSCMRGIEMPEDWEYTIECSESPRATYSDIRNLNIDHARARKAMAAFIDLCKFENTYPNTSYIESIRLK